MQHGAILGGVNVLARVHGIAALLHAGGAAERGQKLDRLVGDEVLGEVEVEAAEVVAQLGDALRVGREPVFEADALGLQRVVMGLQRGPLGGGGDVDGCGCGHGLLSLAFETHGRGYYR